MTKHLHLISCLRVFFKLLFNQKIMNQLNFVIPGHYQAKATLNSEHKVIIRVMHESDEEGIFILADGSTMHESEILNSYVYYPTIANEEKERVQREQRKKIISGVKKVEEIQQEISQPKVEEIKLHSKIDNDVADGNPTTASSTSFVPRIAAPLSYQLSIEGAVVKKLIEDSVRQDKFTTTIFEGFGIKSLKTTCQTLNLNPDDLAAAYIHTLHNNPDFITYQTNGIIAYLKCLDESEETENEKIIDIKPAEPIPEVSKITDMDKVILTQIVREQVNSFANVIVGTLQDVISGSEESIKSAITELTKNMTEPILDDNFQNMNEEKTPSPENMDDEAVNKTLSEVDAYMKANNLI